MTRGQRIAELEADHALRELEARESAELKRLTGGKQDASYEVAAAAVALAFGARSPATPLPPHLSRKVMADAEASLCPSPAPIVTRDAKSTTAAGAQVIVMQSASEHHASRFDYVRWGGWIAAAACLVIVATQSLSPREDARTAAHGGAATEGVALVPGTDPTGSGAAGRISWNAEEQRGELTVRGLATSGPNEEYEAWIVDAARGGNVAVPLAHFAVTAKSETPVSVEMRPPVRVARGSQLLVTVEPVGGVLVSSRARVALEADLAAR